MTVLVFRKGALVPKTHRPQATRSDLPSPRVSRLETYESPVTGKDISSWRERDRDMNAAGAVDPRDIPSKLREERKRIVERNVRSEPAS